MDYRKIIRDRRKEKGLSQEKLAGLIGISRPFMNEIENSKKKGPSVETLIKICNELDIKMFHIED